MMDWLVLGAVAVFSAIAGGWVGYQIALLRLAKQFREVRELRTQYQSLKERLERIDRNGSGRLN